MYSQRTREQRELQSVNFVVFGSHRATLWKYPIWVADFPILPNSFQQLQPATF